MSSEGEEISPARRVAGLPTACPALPGAARPLAPRDGSPARRVSASQHRSTPKRAVWPAPRALLTFPEAQRGGRRSGSGTAARALGAAARCSPTPNPHEGAVQACTRRRCSFLSRTGSQTWRRTGHRQSSQEERFYALEERAHGR